jgi:hypothetical protein
LQPSLLRANSLFWTQCSKQNTPRIVGSPHSWHRPSRFIRNWYLRCRETGKAENSSLIAVGNVGHYAIPSGEFEVQNATPCPPQKRQKPPSTATPAGKRLRQLPQEATEQSARIR